MNSASATDWHTLHRDPSSNIAYLIRPAATTAVSQRLLLLHGVGGNEQNLIGLANLIDPDVEVLVLRAPLTIGPGQYAWFQVQFGANGPSIDAIQAERSRAQLIALLHALKPEEPSAIQPKTVIAGFSQGGILSASVGLTAPENVRGFGILSGRILPEIASQIAPQSALQSLSAFIAHGELDNKLPVSWAHRADQLLTECGVRHQTRLYPMGHELTAAVVTDFKHWLAHVLAD